MIPTSELPKDVQQDIADGARLIVLSKPEPKTPEDDTCQACNGVKKVIARTRQFDGLTVIKDTLTPNSEHASFAIDQGLMSAPVVLEVSADGTGVEMWGAFRPDRLKAFSKTLAAEVAAQAI